MNTLSEAHSRVQDWRANLPAEGLRQMCTWEQFCRFAREPERRRVGPDARVRIDGTLYEVDPDLAGETVVLLWGLFDDELYVEFEGERSGPYVPVSGPIPLHRWRAFKRGKVAETAERLRALADQIGVPISALSGHDLRLVAPAQAVTVPSQPFPDPAPLDCFASRTAAKLAIADEIATPLARLSASDRAFIDGVLAQTLVRSVVIAQVRTHFQRRKPTTEGAEHEG